ncbi:MAG: hypothetical protein IKC89_01765 [Lentisphaeria bacterium]|nr:hypothetical protein [Lentisphaeria bacterium]
MKSSLFILFAAIFSLTVQLQAETIRFRSGHVLAAELTTRKINISGIPAELPVNIPAKPVYAVLTVKLDRFRSISIFDYTLIAYGTEFPCVAINSGRGFVHTDAPVTSEDAVQLLFIADALTAGKAKLEENVLRCKLTPGKDLFDVKVPFSFIGSDAPKTPGTIPESGIIVIKKPEPPKPAAAPGADRKNDSGNTSDSGAEE